MGMKGQISAEMLIILAIVIAVAVVLASQLLKSTKTMSASINESTSTIKSQTEALKEGMYCEHHSDCGPGMICENHVCKKNKTGP